MQSQIIRPPVIIPWISVKSFGAFGDGFTDDTAAVMAAIDALEADGSGTLYFPPGIYIVDNLILDSTDNVLITGYGAILKKTPAAISQNYAGGTILAIRECENVTVEGFGFDGNHANLAVGNTGFGMSIIVCPIEATVTDDFRSDTGGETKASKNILIRNCYFHDNGTNSAGNDDFGDGVYLFGVDGFWVDHCRFDEMG